jgi:hypothetical protein
MGGATAAIATVEAPEPSLAGPAAATAAVAIMEPSLTGAAAAPDGPDDGGDLAATGVMLDLSATVSPASHSITSTNGNDSDSLSDGVAIVLDTSTPDTADAQHQLRGLMDNMLFDATMRQPAGVSTTAAAVPPRTQSHAYMPGHGLISIQQLVAQLNHLAPGDRPCADRLARIAQSNSATGSRPACNVVAVSD